ncbi:glycosyltransferase family 4 protein [Allorhizobium terrae]|uniref:Glycosyltransferase family 4 protein n=1 Tax=Allorhizobium terrae TaxID=1848972 RepID=A0A4S3ZNJ1_9HYPH|nr:glycosyltransferase family 4 protein [Allorhizobium terrae]THF47011.1 glycosyltransferase family 4 protein [Allorhizobium terrae]
MIIGARKSVQVPASPAAPLIVQVVRQYPPAQGGLEDVVSNLSRALCARGFRVRVITLDRVFSAPARQLAAFEVMDGVEVVRIPYRGSSRYPVALSVFRHLADADLVHVHGVDFFFDALALGRFMHGAPMVATTHGGFFHTRKYARIKKIWFQTLTRLSASAYAAIACCSASDLALFRTIQPEHSVLVENGVDTAKFANLASPRPVKRMITIGRFSENKRLDRLLEMMAALVARDAEWRLDIAGSPSDLSATDVNALIDKNGLRKHVSLHVSADNDRLKQLISQSSLFVSASAYEGFGLVAVEAMSAGLLPVLHQNDAYAALAARHKDIHLADFANPQASADDILCAYDALSNNINLRADLQAATLSYSWERVAQRYIELYRKASGERVVSSVCQPQ